MNIKCKLISFEKKKESENDFEFELEHNTPIANTDGDKKSIVFIHGSPYTINIPYKELQKIRKESKTDKDGTRDYS